MKNIDRKYVETPTKEDANHVLLKVSTSLIPGVGEILNYIFEDPAMKRRDDWIQSLADRIETLEKSNITLDDLKNNENFISAVFYASSIAVKTHSVDKHKRLLNALTNTALSTSIDETKQTIFLNLINEFTDLHALVLEFFHNPEEKVTELERTLNTEFYSGSFFLLLKEYYKDKQINDELLEIVVNSLYSNKLITINNENIRTNMTKNGLLTKRTTNTGEEFINFIMNPLE